MSRRAAFRLAAIVLAVLLGVAGMVLWPVNASGYQDRVVSIAQGTLSAVRTVTVLADADRQGDVLVAYVATMMDSARDDVATSQSDLAQEPAEHPDSVRLRDELAPLLDRAAALLADDDTAMRSGPALRSLGDQLASFLDRYR